MLEYPLSIMRVFDNTNPIPYLAYARLCVMNTAYRQMQTLDNTTRQSQVLALRNQRKTIAAIALELGVSHDTVERDYKAALEAARTTRLSLAMVALDEQLTMLDSLIDKHIDNAGDEKHATIILRALDQRARLLGLYPQGDNTNTTPSFTINYNGVTFQMGEHTLHDTAPEQGDIVQGYAQPVSALAAGDTIQPAAQRITGQKRGKHVTRAASRSSPTNIIPKRKL